MKLYADYIKEREGKELLELEQGFATYKIRPPECYIVDIYVKPEYRKTGVAATMADFICAIAKDRGCTTLLGSVNTAAHGATSSMRVLLAYGMVLRAAKESMIYLSKEIN
jgi:GNAT superfamily N-acetyltransferase